MFRTRPDMWEGTVIALVARTQTPFLTYSVRYQAVLALALKAVRRDQRAGEPLPAEIE